jgi:hypothetical protein
VGDIAQHHVGDRFEQLEQPFFGTSIADIAQCSNDVPFIGVSFVTVEASQQLGNVRSVTCTTHVDDVPSPSIFIAFVK